MDCASRLTGFAAEFETAFEAALHEKMENAPPRLGEAVRHAALAGGKRIRPFLVHECASLFTSAGQDTRSAAFAIECVHCYSLVHDDLPAMDDDAMRRGKPTVHIAFDEATAILAGDCLLTLAFEYLSSCRDTGPLSAILARASGGAGMVGGQLLDLAAEGRFGGGEAGDTATVIRRIQSMKTGALITAACEMGAITAGASDGQRRALGEYGSHIGLAFQIADDLLDAEGDAAKLGKAVGKDAHAGKATFVGMLGVEGARKRLGETVESARGVLGGLPGNTAMLSDLAGYIATRDR
ncbi:MAG: polyprenyl synthetase family protein [Rhodobiaceae bacterium]|nr:polyprenyl synthetase family protein [Rhodobiaceae bacterium]MCC0049139.1 polyprenyl synthetase family protein [Rhodobiaceae bacterium]